MTKGDMICVRFCLFNYHSMILNILIYILMEHAHGAAPPIRKSSLKHSDPFKIFATGIHFNNDVNKMYSEPMHANYLSDVSTSNHEKEFQLELQQENRNDSTTVAIAVPGEESIFNDFYPTTMDMANRSHSEALLVTNFKSNKSCIDDIGPPTMKQSGKRSLRRHANVDKESPLHLKWQHMLSRPKRYLSFPEGSSFSVAVCFTVGIIGNPRYNYMSFGLNWGVAYDLPNTSWVLNHLHGFAFHPVASATLRRRTRSSLYKDIEVVADNMGFNGRDCLLRTLCESRQYFQHNKMSMIGEMLRVVFSLPKLGLFTHELREKSDIEHYDHAYRRARDIDCTQHYDCNFSLLELALGKYSTPPEGYYDPY